MSNGTDSHTYLLLKRILDVTGSLFLTVVLFPLMLATAIAIKIDSPGPVLADIPMRVGKNGKLFRLYKFRSMVPNAQKLLMTDPKLKRLYQEYKKNNFKLENDPRITRVGSFIRKYSIDEFPQLFNVLVGNMSLVGPRAYYPFELEERRHQHPHLNEQIDRMLTVNPGMTGLWQVSGRSNIDVEHRIMLDAQNAEQKSILYDLKILLKTPMVVISAKGAY